VAQGPNAHFIDPNERFPNSLRFMENAFLIFLQGMFSAFDPDANGSLHYDDNDALTKIRIEGQNTDNLEAVDTRPKIVVARGPVGILKSGINNFIGSRNLSPEMRRFATIRSGTVGISCYSRNDLEADRIAEICADGIESMVNVIRTFGFLEVRSQQIGQRAMIKSDSRPELFVTPVLIKAQVTKNYKLNVVDPVKLRQIIYEFIVNPVNLKIPPTV